MISAICISLGCIAVLILSARTADETRFLITFGMIIGIWIQYFAQKALNFLLN